MIYAAGFLISFILSLFFNFHQPEKNILSSNIVNTPSIPIKINKELSPTPEIIYKQIQLEKQVISESINVTSNQGLNIKDYLISEINKYRVSKGLFKLQTDSYSCAFAETRAKEISANFNHDGFTNRLNNNTLLHPSYSVITENIAMNSNYKDIVNLWINSTQHEANLVKDTPYACVGNNGNYYAYESWKP